MKAIIVRGKNVYKFDGSLSKFSEWIKEIELRLKKNDYKEL